MIYSLLHGYILKRQDSSAADGFYRTPVMVAGKSSSLELALEPNEYVTTESELKNLETRNSSYLVFHHTGWGDQCLEGLKMQFRIK